MKTLITSAVSLVLGLVIGWYCEHYRVEREKTDIVQQMVQGTETSDCEHAARAARAIQLIDSGEAQQAVQLLSGPVAKYYTLYRDGGGTEEQSRKVRALIEDLAKTNQVVAARLAETSNYLFKKP